MNTQASVPASITHANSKCKKYINLCDEICIWFHFKVGNQFCSLYQVDWWNLMKQLVTVGAELFWSGRYGCKNGRYGCAIVMSYTEINKDVSQWLLTINLCVSVIWPLSRAFHIPGTHTPEIIDMRRGVCDNGLTHLGLIHRWFKIWIFIEILLSIICVFLEVVLMILSGVTLMIPHNCPMQFEKERDISHEFVHSYAIDYSITIYMTYFL